ncbi:MAG: zinc dependent phospholipase C family protein [Acidobacteriaceae bacterium]
MKVSALLAALFFLLAAPFCSAYSFLTHETMIDIAWDTSIKPVLLAHYPGATPAQLRLAHAYAYGGSTIQDAGYYPFGHPIFSDLTHYVRTGDFITNLIHESHNINELAFSLGALSHYVGDTVGHKDAVNVSVPMEFPALEKKYGPVVTYEENEHAHVRTEFAFDIDQLSHARFAPAAYLRHVGFKVPRGLLERAFYATYGISLHSLLGRSETVNFGAYAWAVRQFLPRFAFAEVLIHKKGFPPDSNLPDFQEFAQRLKTADTINGWEKYRKHKASWQTRLVAFVVIITPRIGPLSDLAIRGPMPETEENYVASVLRATDEYSKMLAQLAQKPKDGFSVPDLDLDTGYPSRPGTYRLTDETYAKLLARVTAQSAMPPLGLRRNILAFYSNPNAPITTKRHPREWAKVQKELAVLRAMPATRIPNVK